MMNAEICMTIKHQTNGSLKAVVSVITDSQPTLVHLLKLEALVLNTKLIDTQALDDESLVALRPALGFHGRIREYNENCDTPEDTGSTDEDEESLPGFDRSIFDERQAVS
jgi:hypothetical protein